jgi:ABC transport system ATP-binding/permease protein
LLARLFTRRFNLLVMDEPTNDLDLETLDLLEALLVEFSGTLLLVSHDRAFLDDTVTSTLVFEGGGRIGEYVGGYSDWVRQRTPIAAPMAAPPRAAPAPKTPRQPKPRRLTMKERAELESLPDEIDARERQREETYLALADPAVLRDAGAVSDTRARLAALEERIAALTARWEELATIEAGA